MRIRIQLLMPVLCAAALAASAGANAQSKPTGSGPNPFSDCGIGAALFSDTKWAAVTSNIIWDIGTTAVISATASPETCSGKQVQAALFIGNTYAKLAEETAAGQGEHLTSVLNILECSSARHDAAIQVVRSAMAGAVASADYVSQTRIEKASAFYTMVESAVSNRCAV